MIWWNIFNWDLDNNNTFGLLKRIFVSFKMLGYSCVLSEKARQLPYELQ